MCLRGDCPQPSPTRGISLRNVPRRNPTCATVSPYRAPRTCGPARRRDGSSRQGAAEPNRRESTEIDGSRACRRGTKLQSATSRRRANRVRSATRCNSIPVDSCRFLSTRLWNDSSRHGPTPAPHAPPARRRDGASRQARASRIDRSRVRPREGRPQSILL